MSESGHDGDVTANVTAAHTGPESALNIGSAGQLINFTLYTFAVPVLIAMLVSAALVSLPWARYALMGGTAVGVIYVVWVYLLAKMERYELTTQRLRQKHGVLNVRTDVMELYRVKDIIVEEPLVYRMMGQGTVIVLSSDRSVPRLLLRAIKDPHALADTLREAVENARVAKGVREID